MGFICVRVVSSHSPLLCGIESAHLSLATSEGDVDESSGVLEALKSTALRDLGLLLLLNLLFRMVSDRVRRYSMDSNRSVVVP